MTKKYIVTDPAYLIDACIEDQETRYLICDELYHIASESATLGSEYLSEALGMDVVCDFTGTGPWDNMIMGNNVLYHDFSSESGMVAVCDFNRHLELVMAPGAIFEGPDDIEVKFDRSNPNWTVVMITDPQSGQRWHSLLEDYEDSDIADNPAAFSYETSLNIKDSHNELYLVADVARIIDVAADDESKDDLWQEFCDLVDMEGCDKAGSYLSEKLGFEIKVGDVVGSEKNLLIGGNVLYNDFSSDSGVIAFCSYNSLLSEHNVYGAVFRAGRNLEVRFENRHDLSPMIFIRDLDDGNTWCGIESSIVTAI